MLVPINDDFLLVKYMMLATGIFDDNNELRDLKEFNELVKLFEKEYVGKEDFYGPLINEALYYVNSFNVLHQFNVCPLKYQDDEWGIEIPDEILLFVRLYQQLTLDEFQDLLKTCVDLTFEEFQSLELDIFKLDDRIYIENIIVWLEGHNLEFANNVKRMLEIRKGKNKDDDDIEPKLLVDDIKGLCVVISNKEFEGSYKPRDGTEKDEENLKRTFIKLGYDVKIYRNVKSFKMDNIIEEFKENIHARHRMMIFFILSHGEEESVVMSDGVILPFEYFWKPFTNDCFKKFNGKSKLFFFVCCQGSKINTAVDILPEYLNESNVEFDDGSSQRSKYPAYANLFFGYATVPKFLSCRTKRRGTFYVDELCQVIAEYPKMSISDIHQELQSRVSSELIANFGGFQMPYYKNMLTEHASFLDE